MIDFRSIRVGNILAYCTHPVTIQTIGKNTFGFTDNKNEFQREINNTNFTGIPLSPAILEKAGFEKDGVYYVNKQINEPYLRVDDESNDVVILKGNRLDYQIGICRAKYVHQLQNIVSLITGQELQITL